MNEYMKIAKELARENLITNSGGPFGACIVKDNKIVGRGNNRVLKDNDPTAHAEIIAIKDACKNLNTYDLSGCKLYSSCFPCPMCLAACIWANIKTIYYGNTKEDANNIGFRDDIIYKYISKIESSTEINEFNLINIDRKYTIEEFEDYLKKEDKISY